MTGLGWLQIMLFFVILALITKPLGSYMARIYQGEKTWLDPLVRPIERFFYHLAGVDPSAEMDWKAYALAMLVFNGIGVVFLYILLRLQGFLPLNPQGFGPLTPDTAFNTAVSFVTNTNWQNYSGETSLSYLSQMLGMTVQNFLSAATGMAILIALIRGFVRHTTTGLGNFWVDVTRSTLYVLLPMAIILAIVMIGLGSVQSLAPYTQVNLVQPSAGQTQQIIAIGPAASQLAIKHLGTNGGGFFNANAAHPFENPTPLTDLILIVAETCIPAALTYTFGKMVGDTRQGWAILAAMLILLAIFTAGLYAAESAANPNLTALGVDQTSSNLQPGGNMEGKELRFGIARSAIFAASTTATSTGAVDAMHDSFMPLGGLMTLVLMQLGETVLGGVGSGMAGMLIFVVVGVFVAGLMVGRTPEYLGKKIETYEMKMASLIILIMPIVVLGFTALAVVTSAGQVGVLNPGAHGFSEILYAFTSQGNNNGSAFAGLTGATPFYNITGALAMLIGRFWIILPTLALAGSLAKKKKIPTSAGTLPTHTPLFIGWLIGIVILVGALNFVPALALGPIVEHLLMIGA
jgi:potassium-transporting ATPase potassium-binding subunit